MNLSPRFSIDLRSFTSHLVARFRLAVAARRLALGDAGRSPTKEAESCLRFDLRVGRSAPRIDRTIPSPRKLLRLSVP